MPNLREDIEAESLLRMIHCRHCGEDNVDSVIFCKRCNTNVHWNPNKPVDDAPPNTALGRQLILLGIAVILGFFSGCRATIHVGDVMWGNSPYSEARVMWTSDNSGVSRFSDYGDEIGSLSFAFVFMLGSIPVAGLIAACPSFATYRLTNIIAACACAITFAVGYQQWRLFAEKAGFPQYQIDWLDIHSAYGLLVPKLSSVAYDAGLAALISGVAVWLATFFRTRVRRKSRF